MANGLTQCCQRIYPVGFRYDFIALLKVAWPVVVTNLLQFFILTESIIMCGHLDTYQLDGASLANSILNALGIGVGTGLCTACDTLFSQIYGSPYRERMGVILQRSILVISMFPFLLWILHLNCEPLFIFLGQDPNVAMIAADYMRVFTPGLFFSFQYLILARYLQNQDRVLAPMVVGLVGNVFNVGSQYISIYVLNLGYRASAICQATTFFIMWLIEVLYIVISGLYKETWQGWSVEAFCDWGQFVSLAMPGVGMVTMETISWEIGTFVAGMLGPTWLAVQAILFQLETVTFMISFGISVAVNIRVGQNLGAQDHQRAKTAYRVGLTTVLMTASITAIIFATLANYLPRIFTTDSDVIDKAKIIVQLLGIFQLIDGIGTVTAGALRGCGRQNVGAGFIFLAYYVFGLPSGISLALLTSVKVLGLWIGLFIGLSVSVPLMVLLVNFQNWKVQSEKALRRVQGGADNSQFEENETAMLLKVSPRTRAQTDGSLATSTGHQRTLSQPLGPSLVPAVPLTSRVQMYGVHGRRVVALRIFTYALVLLLFSGGLTLSLLLPRDLYFPKNVTMMPLEL